jgi:hypothetical protein
MLVFLSEYLTSGALPGDGDVKSALAAEGAAMLRALAADAAAVPGWRVAVTWDGSLPPFGVPGVDVLLVAGPEEERRTFVSLAAEAGATLVIAPEFDGLLESRCRLVTSCSGQCVGPTTEAIALCADKLALARHLGECNVPTIPARRCDFATARGSDLPRDGGVVKPRFGAGSLNTYRVTDAGDLKNAETAFRAGTSPAEPILQPFVSGSPLSIAAIVGAHGAELLPVCRQRIGGSKRLHYDGGSVPAGTGRDEEIADLARRALAAVPGLRGYVGLDLILPADGQPVVVEINPRLTSSYHGYRRLAVENLAERILTPDRSRSSIEWQFERIDYSPDGFVWPSTKGPA